MIAINEEGLAAMLLQAHQEGWEKGHDLIPLEPELTYIAYQKFVDGMTGPETRH